MTAASGGQPLLGTASARLPAARVAAIRGQLQRIFEEIAAANSAAGEANGDDDMVPVSLLVGIFSPSQE